MLLSYYHYMTIGKKALQNGQNKQTQSTNCALISQEKFDDICLMNNRMST